MKSYYVNTIYIKNYGHLVHQHGCDYLPNAKERTYLGEFENWGEAVEKAKLIYDKVNACEYCIKGVLETKNYNDDFSQI